jgi:hypothetical protein
MHCTHFLPQVSALMKAEPRAYALALAEGMTGQPLALQGYSPAVDALLAVAPAAALTPEAVAQGHALVRQCCRRCFSMLLMWCLAVWGAARSVTSIWVGVVSYLILMLLFLCILCRQLHQQQHSHLRL